MRDLSSPLGVSIFDGEGKHKRKVKKARRQHAKKTKSKFGEARGIKTKSEDKKNAYCKPGKQLDKSCAGANPRGYKESGRD